MTTSQRRLAGGGGAALLARAKRFVTARWAAPALVAGLALLLYLRTLLPGVAFDDWGEMQTVPHVLGVAHPTGYPTYVLLAWAFGLLPVGEVAFRANLLSAVCAALAMGAAASAGQRLGLHPAIAAAAALATSVVGTVWLSSTVAEVNSLHLLLMALLVDRTLAWADGRRLRDLVLGGLLIGLALGNHALTVFVAPYLVAVALWEGRSTIRAHPAWLLAPVGAALAGMLVYLYIPIAASLDPPLAYNRPVTWDAFRFLVTGEQFREQYGGLLTADGPAVFLASVPRLWGLLVASGSAALPLLAAAGAAALAGRRPVVALALVLVALTGAYLWANYLELEHYLLVPWLVTGLLAGVGLDAGARLASRALAAGSQRWAAGVPAVAASGLGVLVALVLAASNLPAADRSGDRSAERFVDDVLAVLPDGAAIVSYWGATTPLWHATLVQDRRPDILVVDDTDVVYGGWASREARVASLVCERPLFVIRPHAAELEPLRAEYRLTEVARPGVSTGGPTGSFPLPLYRVERPADCP